MTGGSDAIGLVLARPTAVRGFEPYYVQLLGGLEHTLAREGRSLVLDAVDDHAAEIRVYERWAEHGLVDAVIVVNVTTQDDRLDALTGLRLPTIVFGGPRPDLPFANVWMDNDQAMRDAVSHLTGLGHEHLARVSGPSGFAHTQVRTDAFVSECERRGARASVVEGDYGELSGTTATRTLLMGPEPPTAIIYDNDVMAVAGLGTAAELGVDVPDRLSLLAWDDSALCRLAHPPLSAMRHDVEALGVQLGTCALNVLAHRPATSFVAPLPRFVTRGTTGRAPE